MREFQINEIVWHASCGTKEVRHDCPVCFGKLRVTLELGNGERIETLCDYCGKGFEGPRGYVREYEWVADSTPFVVTGKDVSERDGKREVTYRGANNFAYAADVFETKVEADARCAENIAKHEEDERKRLEWSKENNKKNYSWHVGYHMREAKKARASLEWHEARAVHCKARAKTQVEEVAA
jgi:hypothetical protein